MFPSMDGYLTYDPVCVSVRRRSVGWSVIFSYKKGGKLHFHAPSGAHVLLCTCKVRELSNYTGRSKNIASDIKTPLYSIIPFPTPPWSTSIPAGPTWPVYPWSWSGRLDTWRGHSASPRVRLKNKFNCKIRNSIAESAEAIRTDRVIWKGHFAPIWIHFKHQRTCRVFIKYCVFSWQFCDFSELCQFCCSAGFLPA